MSAQQFAIAEARRELARARKRPLPVSLEQELEETELRELALAIAERPELWQHLITHDPEQRTYSRVLHNDAVEVYLICWMEGHDTGFHDHDVSRGAVAVVEGEIIEERLVVGGPPRQLCRRLGDTFDFDASHVHRMRKDDATLAVSIHAYSPPLWRMGAYSVDADGTLRRRSISSAEELRPVETAA